MFRDLRTDSQVINPGDRVFIPDLKPRTEQIATEQTHRFKLVDEKVNLTVYLEDDQGAPLSDQRYSIEIEMGEPVESRTSPDGLISVPIRSIDAVASLTIWVESKSNEHPPIEHVLQLRLGDLDPVTTDSGLQARLDHLGIDPGPIDGLVGPLTKRAIKDFQRQMKDLKVDGVAGRLTRDRLKKEHRS